MGQSYIIGIGIVIVTLFLCFLFYDIKYKNNNLINKLIPFFTLDKMLFKKNNSPAGRKTTMVYFFCALSCIISVFAICCESAGGYPSMNFQEGYGAAFKDMTGEELSVDRYMDILLGEETSSISDLDYWYDKMCKQSELYEKEKTHSISSYFITIIFGIIYLFLLRLIFEFIIIPIVQRPRVSAQYQNQMQQMPMQGHFNMQQPVQQMPVINPNIQTKPKELGVTNMATDIESFAFCSQCGTKYNTSVGNCPKCGMK